MPSCHCSSAASRPRASSGSATRNRRTSPEKKQPRIERGSEKDDTTAAFSCSVRAPCSIRGCILRSVALRASQPNDQPLQQRARRQLAGSLQTQIDLQQPIEQPRGLAPAEAAQLLLAAMPRLRPGGHAGPVEGFAQRGALPRQPGHLGQPPELQTEGPEHTERIFPLDKKLIEDRQRFRGTACPQGVEDLEGIAATAATDELIDVIHVDLRLLADEGRELGQ